MHRLGLLWQRAPSAQWGSLTGAPRSVAAASARLCSPRAHAVGRAHARVFQGPPLTVALNTYGEGGMQTPSPLPPCSPLTVASDCDSPLFPRIYLPFLFLLANFGIFLFYN